MAGYNPYQTNSYQATQFFPQPQGNVYIINNSMEIANIPVGGGISVALCPSEATATQTSASATDIRTVNFSKIVQVLPSCCAINNTTTLTFQNAGLDTTYSNVNVVITKLA